MSIVITRYNAWIADHPNPTKKTMFYSCPRCYALTDSAVVPTITCIGCGFSGPILANTVPVATAAVASSVGATMFIPVSYGGGGTANIQCPCGRTLKTAPSKTYACPCGFSGQINWATVCNACLLNRGNIVPATYICHDNNNRHGIKMPADIAEVGKCTACKCPSSCVKI